MADKPSALQRPKAPRDPFTLSDEPDLVAPAAPDRAVTPTAPTRPPITAAVDAHTIAPAAPEEAAAKPRRAAASKTTKAARAGGIKPATRKAPREERIKTSVEFLPETLDLIGRLQGQHRRRHKRHYPMWRLLDDAVRLLASQRAGQG